MPTANEWEKIQDAGAIVKKAEKLLDDLLDKYPQTERIGLTGQMHGIVYIDQTGTCVSPLYTWQDGRGSLCEKGSVLWSRRSKKNVIWRQHLDMDWLLTFAI